MNSVPGPDHSPRRGKRIIRGLQQFLESIQGPIEGVLSVPAGTDASEVASIVNLGIGVHRVCLKSCRRVGEMDVYPAVFDMVQDSLKRTAGQLPRWLEHSTLETTDGHSLLIRRKPKC